MEERRIAAAEKLQKVSNVVGTQVNRICMLDERFDSFEKQNKSTENQVFIEAVNAVRAQMTGNQDFTDQQMDKLQKDLKARLKKIEDTLSMVDNRDVVQKSVNE